MVFAKETFKAALNPLLCLLVFLFVLFWLILMNVAPQTRTIRMGKNIAPGAGSSNWILGVFGGCWESSWVGNWGGSWEKEASPKGGD